SYPPLVRGCSCSLLIYEVTVRLAPLNKSAIDQTSRLSQFLRTTCLRLWRDERGSGTHDRQNACRRLAHQFTAVARRNSQARPAAATCAEAAISRCYVTWRAKRPG